MKQPLYLLAFVSALATGTTSCSRKNETDIAQPPQNTSSQAIQAADSIADWYKASPIFMATPDSKGCEELPGIPMGLWGNSRQVRVDERISADGSTLVLHGTYENGETATYTMYRDVNRCMTNVKLPTAPEAPRPARQWYAHDINHAHCMPSPSPADKIREIHEFGQTPQTHDLTRGTVEVEVNIGNGKSQVWTFYRSMESCEASLPRSRRIDSKYE